MFPAQRNTVIRAKDAATGAFDPVITAGAYSASDAVGGKLFFPGVSLQRSGSGLIWGFTVIDKSQVKAALKLFLFGADFTAVADNAAFDISDTDALNLVGILSTGSYTDISTSNSVYTAAFSNPIAYRANGDYRLWGQLVCTATPTFTTVADLKVKLHVALIN